MEEVAVTLEASLSKTKNESILRINRYLLEASGKRLRPALVILSAKAAAGRKRPEDSRQLIKIASAVELIHMASLIHDDIIDHAQLRHNKPTINCKWGNEAAIALGDCIYSIAFELISGCARSDILECISSATRAMCEGELIQVCERDNLDLLKQHYIITVKKKTAGLFIASCRAGAMLAGSNRIMHNALKEYGLNLGTAFQMTDDFLDLTGAQGNLGKTPGADFKMGELTLPVLNLLSQDKERNRLIFLLKRPDKKAAFKEIKERFINSPALLKTKEDIHRYIRKAKKNLNRLEESGFKKNLSALADYLIDRINSKE